MSDKGTFKMLTLVGESDQSIEDAVDTAIADASGTVRGMGWFEVDEIRGRITDGKASHYQVKLQVGFRVE